MSVFIIRVLQRHKMSIVSSVKSLKGYYLAVQKLPLCVWGPYATHVALRGCIPAYGKQFLSGFGQGTIRHIARFTVYYYRHLFTNVLLPGQGAEVELQITLQVFRGRFVSLQAWSWVLKQMIT